MTFVPRLKAGIFVRALIRRAEVAGASAFVVRKGAEEAGAVILTCRGWMEPAWCSTRRATARAPGLGPAAGRLGRRSQGARLAGQTGQIRSRSLDRGDRGPRRAALLWMSRSCKLRPQPMAAWHAPDPTPAPMSCPVLIVLPFCISGCARCCSRRTLEAGGGCGSVRRSFWCLRPSRFWRPTPGAPALTTVQPWLAGPRRRAWRSAGLAVGPQHGDLHVHPENGTLMQTGSQAALIVVLVAGPAQVRAALRAQMEGARPGIWTCVLITDALDLSSPPCLFAVRGLEMFLRARRIMGERAAR